MCSEHSMPVSRPSIDRRHAFAPDTFRAEISTRPASVLNGIAHPVEQKRRSRIDRQAASRSIGSMQHTAVLLGSFGLEDADRFIVDSRRREQVPELNLASLKLEMARVSKFSRLLLDTESCSRHTSVRLQLLSSKDAERPITAFIGVGRSSLPKCRLGRFDSIAADSRARSTSIRDLRARSASVSARAIDAKRRARGIAFQSRARPALRSCPRVTARGCLHQICRLGIVPGDGGPKCRQAAGRLNTTAAWRTVSRLQSLSCAIRPADLHRRHW